MRALASIVEYCLQDFGSQSGGGAIPNNNMHVQGKASDASRDKDWISQLLEMGSDNLGGSEDEDAASYHF